MAISKGRFHEKKVAVLLDFVQMRRGGALPKFSVHFSQTIYWVNLGMGMGRSLPIFFCTLALKKSGTICPNWGEGGSRGNLDKIQKNSYFFS